MTYLSCNHNKIPGLIGIANSPASNPGFGPTKPTPAGLGPKVRICNIMICAWPRQKSTHDNHYEPHKLRRRDWLEASFAASINIECMNSCVLEYSAIYCVNHLSSTHLYEFTVIPTVVSGSMTDSEPAAENPTVRAEM